MRTSTRHVAALMAAVVLVLVSNRAYSHTQLFSPNGGEELHFSDQFSVLWEVSISHELENWDLWYSIDSPDGPWIDIAMNIVAGDPSAGSIHAFNWVVPELNAPHAWVRVRMDNVGADYFDVSDAAFSISIPNTLTCDFTGDESCGLADLNSMLLAGPVAPGVAVTVGVNDQFDLNDDEVIDNADVDIWLADAAQRNGLASPYQRGDANLDGNTDGQDFISWNTHKFSSQLRWDRGDFTGDGAVDGADFVAWNVNKFSSSLDAIVPEPRLVLWAMALLFAFYRR